MDTVNSGTEATAKSFVAGKLKVNIYSTRAQMGSAAATAVGQKLRSLLKTGESYVNMIFAAAPSQNEFLQHLSEQKDIDWARVNAFHMDEYVGLEKTAPQNFGSFLSERIFNKLDFNQVHFIDGSATDTTAECKRYAELLRQNPPDIVCMGIGENTHIAFNDPHTADFNDPHLVKLVTLDEMSRQQQVHDGCFASFEQVPVAAITLTVPALLQGRFIYCMVPGKNKALAVSQTINNEATTKFPSTSLKNHVDATLYLDADSAGKL